MNDQSSFDEQDLSEAFDWDFAAAEPREQHLQQLRAQLLQRTTQPLSANETESTAHRKVRSLWPVWSGAMFRLASIAAMLLLCLLVVWPFTGNASASLSLSLNSTRGQRWIHARTIVEHLGQITESESWCSPQKRIAAFRSNDNLHFIDYEREIQASYNHQRGKILLWKTDSEKENFGQAFVTALLTDGDLSTCFPVHKISSVDKSVIEQNGRSRTQYAFHLEFKGNQTFAWDTVVLVDNESGFILSWDDHHANGMRVVTQFDYPENGPESLYDLGVTRDTPVVDWASPP